MNTVFSLFLAVATLLSLSTGLPAQETSPNAESSAMMGDSTSTNRNATSAN